MYSAYMYKKKIITLILIQKQEKLSKATMSVLNVKLISNEIPNIMTALLLN